MGRRRSGACRPVYRRRWGWGAAAAASESDVRDERRATDETGLTPLTAEPHGRTGHSPALNDRAYALRPAALENRTAQDFVLAFNHLELVMVIIGGGAGEGGRGVYLCVEGGWAIGIELCMLLISGGDCIFPTQHY